MKMDSSKAKILVDLLRSPSTDKVVRGLREIKKRLLTGSANLKVFRNVGLIHLLISLVQRPNEDILNGSLSILSGFCCDEEARKEVRNERGVVHIFNVLKCTKAEDLQIRACRTIANQAQDQESCDEFFKLQAPSLIIELLSNCKQDETKLTAIRALRLLANNGEHCQKIITSKGILHICVAGFSSTSNPSSPGLLRSTIKAIAHFSRVSHPMCINQLMEGTDNMMTVCKLSSNADLEIYECILRTIVNIVQSCFVPSIHRQDSLDAEVLGRLCTARAPNIIVSELQNRKVPSIEEEKLILVLCKFCQDLIHDNSVMMKPLYEVPLYMGRAWTQMMECGGAEMLVNLLIKHRQNQKLRPALLKAMLGVEYCYAHDVRLNVMKYLLAAKVLPQVAEQFDEAMREYRSVRRESQQGCCVHSMMPMTASAATSQDPLKSLSDASLDAQSSQEKGKTGSMCVDGNIIDDGKAETDAKCSQVLESAGLGVSCVSQKQKDSMNLNEGTISSASSTDPVETNCNIDKKHQQQSSVTCSHSRIKKTTKETADNLGLIFPDVFIPIRQDFNNHNPRSPGSLSCSPHSYHSGSTSSHDSPLSVSPQGRRSESPTFSPPYFSVLRTSPTRFLSGFDYPSSSSSCPSSPYSSQPQSPRRSTSPIRVPSDWEYEEEEDDKESDDGGRFSPTVPDGKSYDSEDTIPEDEDIEKRKNTPTKMDEGADGESGCEAVSNDMDQDVSTNFDSVKRPRESPSPPSSAMEVPQEKKLKVIVDGSEVFENGTFATNINDKSIQDSDDCKDLDTSEAKTEGEVPVIPMEIEDSTKTPFVKLNQIKFRVRKKGARRQISLPGAEEKSASGVSMEGEEMIKETKETPEKRTQRQRTCSTSSRCSYSEYSNLTADEFRWLYILELLVRVMGQVAYVKEAINPVCREFVPRLMTYLSTAQVIHKSATQMLVTIAKNPLCIQSLLDSLFIPYVAVELGEAGDPESPNGCSQCRILAEGASAFLDQMVNFFNHIHQYGSSEAVNRLHPYRDRAVREGCVMALPHVTRCPKLLHDFMVCYPAMDLLMTVLHSEKHPDEATYMYATAAISRLARTLQLDSHLKPVMCSICNRKGTHTQEEIVEHLKLQQKKDEDIHDAMKGREGSVKANAIQECRWKLDACKDVTFKLDDGSTVSANRKILSEKNDVLQSMLMGSFVEGSCASVDLPGVSKMSLEILIHFLYGCQCIYIDNGEVKTYIDLLFMSQMYLVEKLRDLSILKMMASIKSGEDILKIFEAGVGIIDDNLILQAVCTVLVKPMKTWKRARWMKELFQSKHSQDIDHNMRMILHHPLDMNRLVCNCNQSLSLYRASESIYTKLT